MPISLPLEEMSIEEKIRMMESLWDDLCDRAGSTLSPEWHGNVLATRDTAVQAGEEGISDWEAAKRRIAEDIR